MNPNGTTGSIPIGLNTSNPLIFTLSQDQTSIRPYWTMIVQVIVAQQVHRLVHGLTSKSGFTPLEIGFICWMAKANIFIEKEVLDPLIDIIPTIRRYVLAQPYLQTTPQVRGPGPQRSNQRLVLYVISDSRIQITPRVENVSDISKKSCAKQQRIKELNKIARKYSKKLQFSVTDCVHTLPLLGHSIWYCVTQSSCTSAEDATIWNCYNAFGYRLYNYIFASYFHFCCTFLMKCAYRNKIKQAKLKKLSYYLGLYSSIITFIFVSCLVLPFYYTHIMPMVCAYVFLHIIYFMPMFLLLIFGIFFVNLLCIKDYRIIVASIIIAASIIYTFPVLISVTYNYSQYLYYSDDYFETMTHEYNTRDTATYFKLLQNSVIFLFHTMLNFF
jgi:hypothetical protein